MFLWLLQLTDNIVLPYSLIVATYVCGDVSALIPGCNMISTVIKYKYLLQCINIRLQMTAIMEICD